MPDASAAPADDKKPARGHGRNGADAYVGATRIRVDHETLKPGDTCTACRRGKVYDDEPGILIHVSGQAPLVAELAEQQKLRCRLCGAIFTARAPPGFDEEKYDASATAMIGLLKYGTGMPFYRLDRLQQSLGIPLPASTQWDLVEEGASVLEHVRDELIRQAAAGEVVHNDDTTMKILALAKAHLADDGISPERTGLFTTGIVSIREGRRIALFFTGRKHAGENLADVLKHRAKELDAPIQMCDGLDRNLPKDLAVILANCMAHGRRYFVKAVHNFPDDCRFVLEALREVYHNDALTKERGLSKAERLAFHQEHSGHVMARLKAWMETQIAEKRVEETSGLGDAIRYMLKRWDRLTRFLSVPGAPLDNSICERALKKAILLRKNSLFYKTQNGARVGDIYLSVIHTAELDGVNPFDYLTQLLEHPDEVALDPRSWLPWNYRDAVAKSRGPPGS
jgi:hypothetical protein